MALPNLGAHTDGGTITVGQTNKETTSNALDALLDNSQNQTTAFVTTAGGTLSLATPQANLDLYLDSGLVELTGSPAGAFTVDVPDGDRRIAFLNSSGQSATIDTVTGATPTVTIPDGTAKIVQVRGIELSIIADDSNQTGALLADGTVVATGNFDWGLNQISQVELKDYSETSKVESSVSNAITLDLADGNNFDVTLTEDTTFTFNGAPISGIAASFTLLLSQDAGAGHITTWPVSVNWPGGGSPDPTVTTLAVDLFSFFTVDAGTTWYGFVGGLDFS